jgi:hypothetical protein
VIGWVAFVGPPWTHKRPYATAGWLICFHRNSGCVYQETDTFFRPVTPPISLHPPTNAAPCPCGPSNFLSMDVETGSKRCRGTHPDNDRLRNAHCLLCPLSTPAGICPVLPSAPSRSQCLIRPSGDVATVIAGKIGNMQLYVFPNEAFPLENVATDSQFDGTLACRDVAARVPFKFSRRRQVKRSSAGFESLVGFRGKSSSNFRGFDSTTRISYQRPAFLGCDYCSGFSTEGYTTSTPRKHHLT